MKNCSLAHHEIALVRGLITEHFQRLAIRRSSPTAWTTLYIKSTPSIR